MKNVTIIVLAVLLAAAVISGVLVRGKYLDMKDTLSVCNKEKSEVYDQVKKNAEEIRKLQEGSKEEKKIGESLRRELSSREGMVAGLQEKLQLEITKNAERLKGLESAKVRISQLEDATKMKDQALSSLDEKIRQLEEGSKEEKKIGESLRRELSSREDMVAGLKEKLQLEKSMDKARIEELKSTYDTLASELRRRLKNKEMAIREFEEKVSITFVDRLLFDFGEATITPEGRSILRRVGEILKNVQGMQIRVVGHTDNRPIRKEYQHKFPSNWELSAARAAAVVRYLQGETGLDPESLEIVGRSFYRPVASNETEEGRAQNRRVEVIIAPKIER